MVSNHRVAPAASIPSTSQPQAFDTPEPNAIRKRHRQCLAIVAVASALVVAVLIGATVLIWLALGSNLFTTSHGNSSSTAQSSASITTPRPSFIVGHTIVDYIEVPNVTHDPAALLLTTKPSADSKSNFPPCPSTNQIQCRNDGKCLPVSKKCNKIKDCNDSSDEFNCSCIDVIRTTGIRKLCDGYADCPGGEDELNCAYQCHNTSGLPNLYRCSQSSDCIPISQLCNGKSDCPFGEDESNCWLLSPNLDATLVIDYRTYYDFGYLFKRQNGIWYPISTEGDIGVLANFGCDRVGYKSTIYSDLRILTDSRVDGCFISTGNILSNTQSSLQFRTSCPNRKALYLACENFECGHLPYCRPPRRRIVGGAETGAFCNPWTVALYRDGEMVCQGVVLNNLWLLTAAHCLKNTERRRWIARLGMYRQSSWSPYTVMRRIVAVISHPNFTDRTVETNDIALLRLDRPITFAAALQPPCMPWGNDVETDDLKDGDTCTVFGWGYMIQDGLQFSDELQQVDLTVISNQRCNSTPEFFRTHITDGHLCLGHGLEKKDACQGDSGGPLLCARSSDRSKYLAGLTSTGDGCARANAPSIWTRVNSYVNWIYSILNSTSDQLSSVSTTVTSDRPCTGFMCATGECVYSFFRCDGGWDCQVDGSDELYCSRDKLTEESTSTTLASEKQTTWATSRCGDEQNDGYLCSDGITCLPYYQRCDYILDCPTGEDEKNCFYCLDTDIPCDDNRRCLPFSLNTLANDTFNRWLRDRFDCKGR